MQSIKSDFVTLRISTELLALVAKAAADANVSVSDYVRAVIEEHLARPPGRTPQFRRARQKDPRVPRY